MDARTDIHYAGCPNWLGREGEAAAEKKVRHFTSGVYFSRIPAMLRTATRYMRGGETMGPVHFNKTKVKQEDRYGKRRK
jgi:hypothetical protein